MKHELLPWLILFLPLFSAAAITLFTLRSRALSAVLSVGAVVTGFLLSVIFIQANGWHPAVGESVRTWLSIGGLRVDFGLKLDALSMMMLLIVTGVGGAIHVYSIGYMREDRSFSRFFACMSLFTFSMLGIVLSNNFIELFIFWELVGVSSYLLIGFWFERPSAGDAAKKAFIVNRLGDFGFLLGILLAWGLLGTLNFSALHHQIQASAAAWTPLATAAGLLVFCGAVGKSAQFPLHVWLPDAMEGPTPVSALIHAATMVAAGVYMLCRIFVLLNAEALHVIAYIGGFTALLAALIAIQQDDIKRIIAYSTLSQLGYMVMAVGLSGPAAAMFHLTTHAFFKALLFLGAGSVIIALHHEQNIWKMGNLRRKMPVTFWTFLAGALALSGVWPFSGFFSKDGILAQALAQHDYILFADGALVAGLTTFYIFRLFFVVFYGGEKSEAASHAHETPAVMTLPLVVLAVFSLIGGFIGIERIYQGMFTGETEAPAGFVRSLFAPFAAAPGAASLGLFLVFAGFVAALALYARAEKDPLPEKLGALAAAMKNRFYFDELYEATVIRAHDFIAAVMDWVDRWLVEGLCIGSVRGGTDLTGRALRLLQTGNLQTYAFLFVLGLAVMLWLVLGG
ncbi:MAG: NADH-quinone oxidoreductase subunit L [Verrucomicrobia bacterium]|nr:NADH-quinone oxidoreductase subunit L [Verrucomicrobiota bacterium]MDE3098819.1 NADH-quinone oxidoreductase subunit L [Verrucomicrobiota bacterium]